jgi:hypothetical protein
MITLTNDFHNTQITLKDKAGALSASQVRKAKKALCVEGCTCSDFAGTRGRQYWGEGEERQQVWLYERRDGGGEIEGK